MRYVRSFFSEEEIGVLAGIGVHLDDSRDYSEDELSSIYEEITDNFPYEYDDEGEPKEFGRLFEHIVDVFVKDLKIC